MNVKLTERERQLILSSLFTRALNIRNNIVVLKEMKSDELNNEIAEYQKDIKAILSLRQKLSKENIISHAINDIIAEGYNIILASGAIIIQDDAITIWLGDNGSVEVKSDLPFTDRLFNNLYTLVSCEYDTVAQILEEREEENDE